MKKLFVLIPIMVFLLTGYTYPQDETRTFYIKGHETTLGNVVIYFPSNTVQYLLIEDNSIINTSTNTIYGYCGEYRISFPTYDRPYFSYGIQGTRTYLDITITDNNLNEYDARTIKFREAAPVISVACLIIIIVWRLLK